MHYPALPYCVSRHTWEVLSRTTFAVLDTQFGRPAADVHVELHQLEQTSITSFEYTTLGLGYVLNLPILPIWNISTWELGRKTDEEGRCSNILPPSTTLRAGLYKVIFQTGPYFALTNRDTFFPVVEVSSPFWFAYLLHEPPSVGPYSFLCQPHDATFATFAFESRLCYETRALTGSDACGR